MAASERRYARFLQHAITRFAALLIACVALTPTSHAESALVLRIDSAIGPATADYILSGIAEAEAKNHKLVVLEMDTPGGLDSAMRDIIKGILASRVPVATFVAPPGSRAASAGTYILYASHIAAMTPASNLGAATPVQIGGMPGMPEQPKPPAEPQADKSKAGPEMAGTDAASDAADAGQNSAAESPADEAEAGLPPDAMKAKMVNDAVAYIEGLAELRGRNAQWARQAVREAVSLSAREALELNVIDIVADDIPDLLTQANGREVNLDNQPLTLATADLTIEEFEPGWRIELLTIITDPNVAYLLMLVGIYGLLLEGYNPGGLVPGIVGAICLLMALFAFQVLPVNYAGLGLILLGIALMIVEGFTPSFGVLGIGGLAAFVFGSIILMDTDVPGFGVSKSIIGGVATASGLTLLGLIFMLMRARNRPVLTGAEGMIGQSAEVIDDFAGRGNVFLDGERWIAESQQPLRKGQNVRVTAIHGLVVSVEPLLDDARNGSTNIH
jgi:membrane-bound serine protease (ClpP class)